MIIGIFGKRRRNLSETSFTKLKKIRENHKNYVPNFPKYFNIVPKIPNTYANKKKYYKNWVVELIAFDGKKY